MRHALATLCALLALVALCAAARPAPAQEPSPIPRLADFRYGPDRSVVDAVWAYVAAARPHPARRAAAARELAQVAAARGAPVEARQFACRQLALIGSPAQAPGLIALIREPEMAAHAHLALANIPGPEVDALLRRALATTDRAALPHVIRCLGDRRDPAAAAPLVSLLRGAAGTPVGEAAAEALGRIGGDAAARALLAAYRQAPPARKTPLAHHLLAAAERSPNRASLGGAVAAALEKDPSPAVRAVALRARAWSGAAAASRDLAAALAEDGTPRQRMAAALVRETADAQLVKALAARLPTLPPAGQRVLVPILSDRRSRASAPAVARLLTSPDAGVRVAALKALGALGSAAEVPTLLDAGADTPEERAAAREALAAMRGDGVDAALLKAAGAGPADRRVTAIRALGARRAASAPARMVQWLGGKDAAIVSAAAGVLRDMGGPSHVPALLAAMRAAPVGAVNALGSAAMEAASRGVTEEERTGALRRALAGSGSADERAQLLAMVGQVGGPAALAALRGGLADPAQAVREAVLEQLAEWPTREPIEAVMAHARAAQDARERSLALRAAVRLVDLPEPITPAQAMAVHRQAWDLSGSVQDRRLVLAGVGRIASLAALTHAAGLLDDPDLGEEAALAVAQIGRATLGAWPAESREALQRVAQGQAAETTRKQAADALALADRFGDFVTAWEVSPAYAVVGVNYDTLFDRSFTPEEGGGEARTPWRVMPAGGTLEQPWLLDLLAVYPGEQKVAYLRTRVWSPDERDAVLEVGSDDGPKLWLNGKVVLANNTARAVAPAQEKVPVRLLPGWNRVLLKVTQNVMGWGACVRFARADGSPVDGLRFALPDPAAGVP